MLQADKDTISECVRSLRAPADDKLASLCSLRRLSAKENPPIDAVIKAGLVPDLVRCLQQPDVKMQFEALWVLTNIAAGTSAHTAAVLAAGALPLYVELLDSPDEDVREQAVWAIGNIAGDSPASRNAVLATAALTKILPQLGLHSKPTFVRNSAWAISNCLRGEPRPPPHVAVQVLPTLARLLYSQDKETLVDSLWALSYFTDCTGADDKNGSPLQLTVESGVCARLAELLMHDNIEVQTPALRVVGNIVSGDEVQTHAMINAGALEGLQKLLDGGRQQLKKEASWAVSNIMAGNKEQIQAAIDAKLLPPLVQVMASGAAREVRREACWAISNASSGGTAEQIFALLRADAVPQLANIAADMAGDNESSIAMIALEGLENILRAVPAMVAAELMTRDNLMDFLEEKIFDVLEGIGAESSQEDAALKAREILSNHFPRLCRQDYV